MPDVVACAAVDPELHAVVVEELELSVMAGAFGVATLVVLAACIGVRLQPLERPLCRGSVSLVR